MLDANWCSGCALAPDDTCTMNKSLLNQRKFLDTVIHKGLVWHIMDQVTRCRMVNGTYALQESTLDQVFTSNADLVESIVLSAPIGQSDHVIIKVDLKIFDNADYMVERKKNWAKM